MTRPAAPSDPVLRRFRADVEAAYGSRVERVVLFGSRARGDGRSSSDHDVAVFLHDPGPFWDELGQFPASTWDCSEGVDLGPSTATPEDIAAHWPLIAGMP